MRPDESETAFATRRSFLRFFNGYAAKGVGSSVASREPHLAIGGATRDERASTRFARTTCTASCGLRVAHVRLFTRGTLSVQSMPAALSGIFGVLVGGVISGVSSAITTAMAAERTYRNQRLLESQRLDNQRLLDERRYNHDREMERQRVKRAAESTRRSVLVLIRALYEVIRPLYVRGSLNEEAWSRYNELLLARLDQADVSEYFDDELFDVLWSVQQSSAFTRWFIIERRLKPGSAAGANPDETYDWMLHDLEGLARSLVSALQKLGDAQTAGRLQGSVESARELLELKGANRLAAARARLEEMIGDQGETPA